MPMRHALDAWRSETPTKSKQKEVATRRPRRRIEKHYGLCPAWKFPLQDTFPLSGSGGLARRPPCRHNVLRKVQGFLPYSSALPMEKLNGATGRNLQIQSVCWFQNNAYVIHAEMKIATWL